MANTDTARSQREDRRHADRAGGAVEHTAERLAPATDAAFLISLRAVKHPLQMSQPINAKSTGGSGVMIRPCGRVKKPPNTSCMPGHRRQIVDKQRTEYRPV